MTSFIVNFLLIYPCIVVEVIRRLERSPSLVMYYKTGAGSNRASLFPNFFFDLMRLIKIDKIVIKSTKIKIFYLGIILQ